MEKENEKNNSIEKDTKDEKNQFLSRKTKRDKENNQNINTSSKPQTTFFKEDFQKDEENEQNNQPKKNENWINKTRVMLLASRGVSHQERHLVNDLVSLLPNCKKESKIEKSIASSELSNICYMHSCNYCLYFEHRKREFVLYLLKCPTGPCIKFAITNIYNIKEIRFLGNCIKYSRPLLSFDKSFDSTEHLKLIKQMLLQTFNSPKNHPKTKPFYDHMFCFYNINNKIYFRVYQIVNEIKEKFTDLDKESNLKLIEIGPRLCLNLIRIFEDSFGGKTLYRNKEYLAPGKLKRKKEENFKKRKMKEDEKKRENENKRKNEKKNINYKWMTNNNEDDDIDENDI